MKVEDFFAPSFDMHPAVWYSQGVRERRTARTFRYFHSGLVRKGESIELVTLAVRPVMEQGVKSNGEM